MRSSRINERAAQVLAEVGSTASPTTLVSSLSTGERQLVEIAKALASDARVVIMDEPTAALSAGEVAALHNAVRKLAAKGISVIYITHKLPEVFALANRVSVMRDGRLVATFETAETTKDELVLTMLGKTLQSEVADASGRRSREKQSSAQTPDAPPTLAVKNLCTAGQVRDVSFDLHAGEILGMAGLVGAGRTETVRALFGLEKIVSGEITLSGRKFKPASPHKSLEAGIAMVPEDRKTQGLLLEQTVENNVTLPHVGSKSPFGWINFGALRRMTQTCIDLFDVRPRRPDAKAKFMSGGNQQKILIGRWMLKDYRVMIFDEPSKGVDVGARAGIWKMVRASAARGAAVIVVSSETEELIALSHSILVMRQGRVTAHLYNIDLTEEEVMTHAF